jgi:hypothetical protein
MNRIPVSLGDRRGHGRRGLSHTPGPTSSANDERLITARELGGVFKAGARDHSRPVGMSGSCPDCLAFRDRICSLALALRSFDRSA